MKKLLEESKQLDEGSFNDKHTIQSVINTIADQKVYLNNMDESYPELGKIFTNIDKLTAQLYDLKKTIERYSF